MNHEYFIASAIQNRRRNYYNRFPLYSAGSALFNIVNNSGSVLSS
nr:MAG TPA: hypothetical protein [Caudoviricetes sp.]